MYTGNSCASELSTTLVYLHLSTGLQQPLDSLNMAIQSSLMEGRPVVIGQSIHLSTSVKQHLHHANIACITNARSTSLCLCCKCGSWLWIPSGKMHPAATQYL